MWGRYGCSVRALACLDSQRNNSQREHRRIVPRYWDLYEQRLFLDYWENGGVTAIVGHYEFFVSYVSKSVVSLLGTYPMFLGALLVLYSRGGVTLACRRAASFPATALSRDGTFGVYR